MYSISVILFSQPYAKTNETELCSLLFVLLSEMKTMRITYGLQPFLFQFEPVQQLFPTWYLPDILGDMLAENFRSSHLNIAGEQNGGKDCYTVL